MKSLNASQTVFSENLKNNVNNKNKANSPTLSDHLTDAVLFIIYGLFSIYSKILTVLFLLVFPLTKWVVKNKLKIFDIEIIEGNEKGRPSDIR